MRFFFTGPRILGIRPGIIFGASDIRRVLSSPRQSAASQMTGGFVYVLENQSGCHKIGSSVDPISRRAQLQTGSAEELKFAFIGVAPDMSYARIERTAHDLLQNQRIPNGGDEWFRVPASIAIGAVYEAAQRLGDPIQQVPPEMVPQIIYLAKQPDPAAASSRDKRMWGLLAGTAWWVRWPISLTVGAIVGVVFAMMIWLMSAIANAPPPTH